ncbi:MAG: hypothetical protein QG555_97 [Thermodesulfobacteriota bacterium]|nr:hypothetical protein [Thermodesulfobacteriota bacterium]
MQIENIRNNLAIYNDILKDWFLLEKIRHRDGDPKQRLDAAAKNTSAAVGDARPATAAGINKDKRLDNGNELAWADFILTGLQGYLLPLLTGLLGAWTYTLRSLSSEIRNLTYTGKSRIRYHVRAVLGMLCGLAITWFVQPGAAILKSLSSFALAFLAGYSVEILFAVMDRFVGAFSGKETAQNKTT